VCVYVCVCVCVCVCVHSISASFFFISSLVLGAAWPHRQQKSKRRELTGVRTEHSHCVDLERAASLRQQ
jgi:hypothetical protein